MNFYATITVLSILVIAYIFTVMIIRAYFTERKKYVIEMVNKVKETKRHG